VRLRSDLSGPKCSTEKRTSAASVEQGRKVGRKLAAHIADLPRGNGFGEYFDHNARVIRGLRDGAALPLSDAREKLGKVKALLVVGRERKEPADLAW
jgi:hypothetical protein